MEQQDYVQTLNPLGYRNNGEITNLPGLYLVKGSRDCVIVNREKVSSRKGYTLVGSGKDSANGHKDSYDWETNRNFARSLRLNKAGELEAYFVAADGTGSWTLLKQFSTNTRANFAPWWDGTTEIIDMLLFVTGTDEVHMWSGGIVEVASATATEITMKGYLADTSIAFVEGGASEDTITDSNNGFVTAGFQAGDTIIVSGSGSNDGTYTIKEVAAGTLTLYPDDDLADEVAGASVIIKKPDATWAEQGFLTAGTRKVRINDVEYTYTGGEDTGTLTGLTGVSGVNVGDIAMQAVRTSEPATLDGLTLDLIAVHKNHVFYGSLKSREINMSSSTDYTSFSKSSPRAPGEGEVITIDSTPTAFIPEGGPGEMHIHGRKNDIYKLTFKLSSELSDESIIIEKIPTSTGQAAYSQGAVIRIKNAVAFLSFEPTIDTVGRILAIDTATSKPISYDIKDDLIKYNLTDANGLFYQNQIFITLPSEGIVLIYDTEQELWQPPQYLPVGSLALIDVDGSGTQVLCGHSSVGNETYRLYNGYNDNGAPIQVEMHFGYENYGSRFNQKSFDEIATELYMSENTVVENEVLYDYKGATDIRSFNINGDGSDGETLFTPAEGSGLGSNPLGTAPLGSLGTEIDDLSKVRVVDTTSLEDFFERQRVFKAEGVDIRFAVIAYGENVESSDNIPTHIKR
jgi:hypothetical protein